MLDGEGDWTISFIFKSVGIGFGPETFAEFLEVSISISKNFLSEKNVLILVSENLAQQDRQGICNIPFLSRFFFIFCIVLLVLLPVF